MPEFHTQSDTELLKRYVDRADQSAFAELVRRYWGFVASSARRQIRQDPSLVDDVTQATFIVLARKASSIRPNAALPAWLHSVARHAALNAMKIRYRQQAHECRAAEARSTRETDDAAHALERCEQESRMRGLLDESIARLSSLERSGVILHFLSGQTHEQVGAALGLSTEAARKRVGRALEKMRHFLVGRGVTVGADTSAVVATLYAERAVIAELAPPTETVASTVNVAVLSSSASGASTSMSIAQGASQMLALAKLKAAAVVGLALVAVGAAAIGATVLAISGRTPIVFTQTTLVSTHATAAEDPHFTTKVGEEVSIRFLGVARFPNAEAGWHAINGAPIDAPLTNEPNDMRGPHQPEHQIVIEFTKPRGVVVQPSIEGAMLLANQISANNADATSVMTSAFTLQEPGKTADMRIGISATEWQTVAEHAHPEEEKSLEVKDMGMLTFSPVRDEEGSAVVEATYAETRQPQRIVVIDDKGEQIESHHVSVSGDGEQSTGTYKFENLSVEKVRKVLVQVRPFTKVVHVKDISLSPDHPTTPTITVEDVKKP